MWHSIACIISQFFMYSVALLFEQSYHDNSSTCLSEGISTHICWLYTQEWIWWVIKYIHVLLSTYCQRIFQSGCIYLWVYSDKWCIAFQFSISSLALVIISPFKFSHFKEVYGVIVLIYIFLLTDYPYNYPITLIAWFSSIEFILDCYFIIPWICCSTGILAALSFYLYHLCCRSP